MTWGMWFALGGLIVIAPHQKRAHAYIVWAFLMLLSVAAPFLESWGWLR